MTTVARLARFVVDRSWNDLSDDVNLFVDHTVQLECLRAGIWGTHDTWGRMLTYRSPADDETP